MAESSDPGYERVDGTTWPVRTGDVQWALRYGNDDALQANRLIAASIVASYAYLTNPSLTQADAIIALKRARRAAKQADAAANG